MLQKEDQRNNRMSLSYRKYQQNIKEGHNNGINNSKEVAKRQQANTPLIFYSINTMLHQQDEECWDNNVDDDDDSNDDAIMHVAHDDENDHSHPAVSNSTTAAKGILRQTNNNTANDTHSANNNTRSNSRHSAGVHFPQNSSIIKSIRTRPKTSILDIPILYYSHDDIQRFKRGYQRYLCVQSLATRERMELNSRRQLYNDDCREEVGGSDDNSAMPSRENGDTKHQSSSIITSISTSRHVDNSFWRTKVHRRWQRSISLPVSVSLDNKNDDDTSVESAAATVGMMRDYQNQSNHHGIESSSTSNNVSDPLMNDHVVDRESNMALDENEDDKVSIFSSYSLHNNNNDDSPEASSSGGVLWSVIKVAREAVSVLNGGGGPSSSSSRYNKNSPHPPAMPTAAASSSSRQQCNSNSTSVHLVDTLYLF